MSNPSPKRQLIAATAAALHSYGYQVYLDKTKTYGFYTDGEHVVTFGGCWHFSLDFSGCYRADTAAGACSCGTGWGIDRDVGTPDRITAAGYINAYPPTWATGRNLVRHTTPKQHLDTYGQSSDYTLYQPEEIAS